jgi:hypothetical protein
MTMTCSGDAAECRDRIFKTNAAPVGRLSHILHHEPVVAGARFRGRTAVVTRERGGGAGRLRGYGRGARVVRRFPI